MGLPLETGIAVASPAAGGVTNGGFISPLMYFKGIREVTFGATLMALQRQGNEEAITSFAAILSFTRLADGLVVWLYGGDTLKTRAWGHWITGLGLFAWATWRWRP